MLADCRRYAVYFTPPAGAPLAEAGAAWLGWDAERGVAPSRTLDAPDLPEPRERLVARARRYGFHATLKAPFALAKGMTTADLDRGMAALAASRAPVRAPRLVVCAAMGFVALRPSGPSPALDALAAACVTQLDAMRQPLGPAELAERRRAGLDMAEDAHLRAWGYPYVLDRFRFHMTLTGPLARLEAGQAAAALQAALAPALAGPLQVDDICLFGEPDEGAPFRLLRRYPLTGDRAD